MVMIMASKQSFLRELRDSDFFDIKSWLYNTDQVSLHSVFNRRHQLTGLTAVGISHRRQTPGMMSLQGPINGTKTG